VKIVLDTNVFISGIFFRGPPYQILQAWRDNKLQIILSQEILEEYHRVAEELAAQFLGVDLRPILELLTIKAELIPSYTLSESVSDDPDDDKFIACALASKTRVVVSGDKHLLKVSGYDGVEVVRPRKFVDDYLPKLMRR
jgi:putative PIN family toxin of toxin-antitoxin system